MHKSDPIVVSVVGNFTNRGFLQKSCKHRWKHLEGGLFFFVRRNSIVTNSKKWEDRKKNRFLVELRDTTWEPAWYDQFLSIQNHFEYHGC